ncbi:MAG: esterase family protein [Opitutus sp.]|nr:esterase family protein [Opitutus sp.]
MKNPLAFALALALFAPAFAQPPNAGGAGAPKQKAKKEFREPTWKMPPVEGPNLHYQTFQSKAAGEAVSYLIYLPPDYDTAKDRRYPAVYWLHGIGGAQAGVPAMAGRLTEAIAAKKTPPMIVVYVNGMINSGYADGKYAVETVTIEELIPHIDATYRTIATRDRRVIEGFSMGGGGAAKWGFKYPELFGTVSILAGAMRNPAAPSAPGMTERDPADSPWLLVEKNLDKIRGHTAIRVVVGGKDGLKETNTKYHELLDRLGLAHEFHVIADAIHSPNPLYDGLGDQNWSFYRAALARENVDRK